jgi:hypothetical protein
MQTNYEILELFPTPVFTTVLPLEFSKITPWLFKQEMLSEEIDSPNYGERSKNSYILEELSGNGFVVRYTHPNLIFVSWQHYIPT